VLIWTSEKVILSYSVSATVRKLYFKKEDKHISSSHAIKSRHTTFMLLQFDNVPLKVTIFRKL